jgi:hypothetical protein
MKFKIITISVVALALTAFTPFAAAEKDIVGTWKIEDASIVPAVNHMIAKIVKANPAAEAQVNAQKDQIIQMVQAIRLHMKADHSFESVTPQGTAAGKWALGNKGRVIEFIKPDGSIRRDSILASSASRLKLINGQMKDTILYVHQ